MKRYDSYKDSGIDWIGEIPSHWEVKRLKFLSKVINGFAFKSEDIGEKGEKLVRIGDINNQSEFEYKRINIAKYVNVDLDKFKVSKGDVVIALTGATIGKSNVYEFQNDAYLNQRVGMFRASNQLLINYLKYTSNTESIQKPIQIDCSGSAQDNISVNQIANFGIALPPLSEQKAIADFLDEKCGQIDTAVSLKDQQIDKLKELRQSVIHKAVTQGLDANTEMKDSGVDWIGEIPKHWEVKRFRNIFSLGKGLTITKENLQEHGVFCVNYGEIHSKFGFQLNPEINVLTCVSVDYLKGNRSSLLNNGDFVFADTSEDLEGSGNFTYLNSDSTTFAGYHTVIARPTKGMYSRFLAYEFDSIKFRNQVRAKVKGVKVYSITQTILKELLVWLPPLSEQEAIVFYLDVKTAEIDKAIDLKQSEITQLKSYKSSLINEVVTGKIRVATT